MRIFFLIAGLLAACTSAFADDFRNYDLVTDTRPRVAPEVGKPAYLHSFTDPLFGTRITRITGDPGTRIPAVGGVWPKVARHHYSKDAAWNADQSLIVLTERFGRLIFLNGDSYRVLFDRAEMDGEVRWHPRIADRMIYVKLNGEIGHWNPRSNQKRVLFRARGYENCQLGPYEGNPSYSGKRIVVAAKRADGHLVAFALNLEPGRVHKFPDIDLTAGKVTNLDWASISASGRCVVVNGTIRGNADTTQVFSLSGRKTGPFWKNYGEPSHYDLTYDASGREVAVGVTKSGRHDGKVIMRRLTDGRITVLNNGGYASHASARNYRRRGWAYITTNHQGSDYPPFRNEVYAVKLDGSGMVQRLASLRSIASTYYAESHATPSPDGKRVVFASNWMRKSGPIQAYVVDIRGLRRVP